MKMLTRSQRTLVAGALALLLAACGGGGGDDGGSTPKPDTGSGGTGGSGGTATPLNATLAYAIADEYPLWMPATIQPIFGRLGSITPTCVLDSGAIPPGMQLHRDSCIISGTPNDTGPYTFTVRLTATGYTGSVTSPVRQIQVQAPRLNYQDQPIMTQLFWQQPSTSRPQWTGYVPQAGDTVTNFRVYNNPGEAGLRKVPHGLSLDTSTGEISGTWIGLGVARFRVLADVTHNGRTVTAETGDIEPWRGVTGIPDYINYPKGTALSAGRVGQAFSYPGPHFDAGLAIAPVYTGEYSIHLGRIPSGMAFRVGNIPGSALPAGLTLDPRTGVISGIPTEPFDGFVIIWCGVRDNTGAGIGSYDRVPLSIAP